MLRTNLGCRGVGININGISFSEDLIVIKSQGLEVILGMDWLAKHQSILDCANRALTMTSDQGIKVKYVSELVSTRVPQVNNLSGEELDRVPIVCEYPDVFPDELPGMPPDRDIEFIIELMPGSRPIHKKPYRMGSKELAELKKQLDE